VGLDALDPDLTREWAEAGVLPGFARLFERGTSGMTVNPEGLFVGAVWPSFFTGVSPARHGRYCFKQIVTGTYTIQRFQPGHLKYHPFWNTLSEAGRRVAIVDVPKSPLAATLNGIQLKDWGPHDPERGEVFQTVPATLAAEITATYGSDPVGDCDKIERTTEGYRTFARNLLQRIEQKTAICRDLLGRDDWDLFLAVYPESHCVGHQCWTIHDSTHPDHDPELARRLGDPLRDVYVSLDRAVTALVEFAGPDTTVIVLASHGMGPHYDATFMLDQILERLEPRPAPWRRWMTARLAKFSRRWRSVPPPRRKPNAKRPLEERLCFPVPNNDVYGGIRVNLAGREPAGRIQPGAEFERFYAALRRDLLQLVNVDTGEPVVQDVHRSTDLYRGEYLADLPDFLVEWNRAAPISRVSSPRIGLLERAFPGVRTGDHKPEGLFWVTGPGVPANATTAPVSVMDFAPTVGALLGVPMPDVDGTVIRAITPA
jgi:predicted AlkP superfamily phosphohydrolase/phosphomutase